MRDGHDAMAEHDRWLPLGRQRTTRLAGDTRPSVSDVQGSSSPVMWHATSPCGLWTTVSSTLLRRRRRLAMVSVPATPRRRCMRPKTPTTYVCVEHMGSALFLMIWNGVNG
jgi:hypothetical protein